MRPEPLRSLVTRTAALGVVLGTALVGSVGAPVVAHEVARTSAPVVRAANGERCTIVGTPRRDHLHGTPGRDVICGLGGNDFIYGRGSDDVIDGGPGKDYLGGGGGDDLIVGGPGKDFAAGEYGDDVVSGGGDEDDVRGGPGADQVDGGAAADEVTGNDGADVATGGAGDDELEGGSGPDEVNGGGGDDELSGGAGSDDVDGQAGFNICDIPDLQSDQQIHCITDRERPAVDNVTWSSTSVDVSAEEQFIQVRAHVTDDTGVKSFYSGYRGHLVSGTVRDGIWASTIRVPRFITPGPRELSVGVTDRVGRSGTASFPAAYTVVNTVYDREMPVLQSLALSASSVDVRSASKTITVTARITDDLVGPGSVYVCPAHAFPTESPAFRSAGGCERIWERSGTRRDSIFAGEITIPKGAPGGTWDVSVSIGDGAENLSSETWWGPESLAAQMAEPFAPSTQYKAIPGGVGSFTVLGGQVDAHPPVLTSFSLSKPVVDTSFGAVRVTAEIVGADAEGITAAYVSVSGYPDGTDSSEWLTVANLNDVQLVSGSPTSGTWRGSFVVVGGMPDGTYSVQVALRDTAHWESWVSPDSGWHSATVHLLDETIAPSSTRFVVANSG